MAVVADVGGLLAYLGENHDCRRWVSVLERRMLPAHLISQY